MSWFRKKKDNRNYLLSDMEGGDSWTCHICGERRPDALIGVKSTTEDLHGIEMVQNVRHCVDKVECVRAAQTYKFFQTQEAK